MKEAIIYDMYQYIGATSSLYNYAKVSVNGEYWGVYLALEAVEESFMLRNFGTQDGELYKPESMEMGGFTNASTRQDSDAETDAGSDENSESKESSETKTDSKNMPDMSGGSSKSISDRDNFKGAGFENSDNNKMKNLAMYGMCMAVMLVSLGAASIYKRRK